ncbi:MAG: RNA methyltransferase [Planctomycetes bacterium]|nr:RNA methyltransferase [Planctomycetota bacterium]
MMNDDDIKVKTGDTDGPVTKHPIVLVLDNLRSAFNVGNMFRLADICGVERIVTCGYTATPPHRKVAKTALGTDKFIPSTNFDTSLEAVRSLKTEGYQTVGIETVEGAQCIWDIDLQFPVAFVLGNEVLGVERETLKECDALAKLPVFGRKNSLNVANCAAVVVYSAIQQILSKGAT